MAELNLFYGQIKPKKQIKSKKHADFGCKSEKLASYLKMNITKMGKMKSEKLTIIFAF